MEKKAIFLELPADIVDTVDSQNVMKDRSAFISDLLRKQLQNQKCLTDKSFESTIGMDKNPSSFSNDIRFIDKNGKDHGCFDINSVEGFENLAKKINEMSNNPNVKMRARLLL